MCLNNYNDILILVYFIWSLPFFYISHNQRSLMWCCSTAPPVDTAGTAWQTTDRSSQQQPRKKKEKNNFSGHSPPCVLNTGRVTDVLAAGKADQKVKVPVNFCLQPFDGVKARQNQEVRARLSPPWLRQKSWMNAVSEAWRSPTRSGARGDPVDVVYRGVWEVYRSLWTWYPVGGNTWGLAGVRDGWPSPHRGWNGRN